MDPIRALAALPGVQEPASGRTPDLDQAARDFEGYLVGAMLRVGTRPIGEETPLDGGPGGRMYRELFYDEVARLAARGEGFGISELLHANAPAAAAKETE